MKESSLDSLLADFASQHITVLKQPARVAKFAATAGPRILELEVRRVEAEGSE